ncbi:MAG: hypothetical protein ABJN04_02480 [Hyphomicrobiales bacterium]
MNLSKKIIFGILFVLIFLCVIFIALRFYTNPETLGGFSSDTSSTNITIADTRLYVPKNMIRFKEQRTSPALSKLDLFIQWPSMKGFTKDDAATFQNINGTSNLVFVTLEVGEPLNSAEQKLNGLYRRYFSKSPWRGPAGLIGNELDRSSGYLSEDVLYAKHGDDIFLTRCMQKGKSGTYNLQPTCIYEFTFEDGINVYVRFHHSHLAEWQVLDERVKRLLATMRTTN